MSTTRRIIDGVWRGERKCIDAKAGDADLWKFRKNCIVGGKRDGGGSGHVKAHRTKKDKKDMSHFEKLDEKADELANVAILDEGFMAEVRAKNGSQHAASFHCLWRNGKILKSSSRSQKKGGDLWIRKKKM